MTSRAVSLYSAALALYPRAMREEYGDAMIQLFADRYRDERPDGDVFRFVRFWGGMIGDLVWSALTERTESVVSNVKQQWWKWAIGLIAAFYSVFILERVVGLFGSGADRAASIVEHPDVPLTAIDITTTVLGLIGIVTLIVGLRTMRSRPRRAAWLLAVGLVPAMLAGIAYIWFPPMYLVSALAIYLAVRAFMEAGRLTRNVATAN